MCAHLLDLVGVLAAAAYDRAVGDLLGLGRPIGIDHVLVAIGADEADFVFAFRLDAA